MRTPCGGLPPSPVNQCALTSGTATHTQLSVMLTFIGVALFRTFCRSLF